MKTRHIDVLDAGLAEQLLAEQNARENARKLEIAAKHERALVGFRRALRHVKLSNTLLKKWRRKVRYYEKLAK